MCIETISIFFLTLNFNNDLKLPRVLNFNLCLSSLNVTWDQIKSFKRNKFYNLMSFTN